MTYQHRFEWRRSPVDRAFRAWERRRALALGLITQADVDNKQCVDGPIWVCTGVYDTKRDLLKAQGVLI